MNKLRRLRNQLMRAAKASANPTAIAFADNFSANVNRLERTTDETERAALRDVMRSNLYWLERTMKTRSMPSVGAKQ